MSSACSTVFAPSTRGEPYACNARCVVCCPNVLPRHHPCVKTRKHARALQQKRKTLVPSTVSTMFVLRYGENTNFHESRLPQLRNCVAGKCSSMAKTVDRLTARFFEMMIQGRRRVALTHDQIGGVKATMAARCVPHTSSIVAARFPRPALHSLLPNLIILIAIFPNHGLQ